MCRGAMSIGKKAPKEAKDRWRWDSVCVCVQEVGKFEVEIKCPWSAGV